MDPVSVRNFLSMTLGAMFLYGIFVDIKILFNPKRLHLQPRVQAVPWLWTDVLVVMVLFFIFAEIAGLVSKEGQSGRMIAVNARHLNLILNYLIQIITVIFILGYLWARYGVRMLSDCFHGSIDKSLVGLMIKTYAALLPIFLAAPFISKELIHYFDLPSDPQPIVKYIQEEAKKGAWLIWLVFASILAPFLEEIFFRGFIYPVLKKYWGMMPAMIITAVFFAILHFSYSAFLIIFILGIVLTCLYEKTGNLWASVIFHSFNNFMATLIVIYVAPEGVLRP